MFMLCIVECGCVVMKVSSCGFKQPLSRPKIRSHVRPHVNGYEDLNPTLHEWLRARGVQFTF